MAYYEAKEKNFKWGLLSLIISMAVFSTMTWVGLDQFSMSLNKSNYFSYLFCFFIFLCTMALVKQSSNPLLRGLCYIGILSYPIYLLHQDIDYIFIKTGTPYFVPILSAFLSLAFISILAFIVYNLFETKLTLWLRGAISSKKHKYLAAIAQNTSLSSDNSSYKMKKEEIFPQ